jgi:hypothetical protein
MNTWNFSNLTRLFHFTFAGCMILQLAFVGCTSTDEPGPTQAPAVKNEGEEQVMGEKVFEDQLSKTSKFAIYKQEDGLMLQMHGNMDQDEKIISGLENSLKQGSLLDVYNKIQSLKEVAVPAPKLILDLDAESRLNESRAAQEPQAPLVTHGTDAQEDIGNKGFLAKSGAAEPAWDWDADARWFRDVVHSFGRGNHEFIETNMARTGTDQNGSHHFAVGMAASHIASAQFRGWYQSCGWFSCSNIDYFNVRLEPRAFTTFSWRGSSSSRTRSFLMTGLDPSKRVHFGLMWD